MKTAILDLTLVEDIEFDGIDHNDCPDFSDAYICSATYKGEAMTQEQLELLSEDGDFVYQELMNNLY